MNVQQNTWNTWNIVLSCVFFSFHTVHILILMMKIVLPTKKHQIIDTIKYNHSKYT